MIEEHLEKLITLVGVVDAGSIRGFATRTRASQPAVSQRIASLERALGIDLLARSRHGVALTEKGAVVYRLGKSILQATRETESALAFNTEKVATLRFGTYDSIAIYLLPKLIERLRQTHPLIRISLICERSAKIFEMLAEGTVDLALCPNPKKVKQFQMDELYKDEYGFFQSEGRPSELRSRLITLPDATDAGGKSVLSYLQSFGLGKMELVPTPSFEIARAMTSAGLGVGVLPTRVASSPAAGVPLKRVGMGAGIPSGFGTHPFGLIYPRGSEQNPHLRAVREEIVRLI